MTLPAGPLPGLEQLIHRLRQAPLQVPVGTSEAIDAARLLAHLAARPGSGDAPLEALRLPLRPVLCKAAGDLDHFNQAFDDWVKAVLAARGQTGGPPPPPPPPPPPQKDVADARAADRGGAEPAPPFWRRSWVLALAGLLLAAVVLALLWPQPDVPAPAPATLPASQARASARPLPLPTVAPSAPQPAAPLPAPRADTGPAIRGYTPDWHLTETLRWPWLMLLLGLPLLGLLPLLGAPPPLPYITRQRGAGSLTLEAWPPHKQRRQLVRDIAPATSGQLQRHVRGAVDQREAYARRPRLDLRRTVNASLARGGLLQLHYRFARLRPAYLVLVHARQDDDLGVLWARRLADLDVRAAIFRFHPSTGDADPACVEVGGLGRRLPFSALPAPWPEQRLVVIGRCSVLVGADGQLHGWVRRARLGRWAQRVLFNPDEPRDWPRRQVQALESTRDGGLGLQVLPFEDNALDAWSDWLVRGELPPITLEAPQLYPRLLKENEARFCGDTQPADLHSDPAQAEKLAQQIVTQLQAYLGQNGFYWLCACAVPPLLEQRLAQLLGEEYFRRCGASEPAVATYMARNWRLLVRLPWLRPQPQPLPQWLRLALLARLPPAIQDELREVVRGALGRRAAASRPGDGLALAFDAPDAPPLPGATRVDDPRHALLVGFVKDGLDARELMLRLPGAWQQWLPAQRPRGRARRGWLALQGGWQRWQRADAALRGASLRWAAAGVLLGASALVALPTVPASQWPAPMRGLLFQQQAQGIAFSAAHDNAGQAGLALGPSARLALVFGERDSRLVNTITGRVLTEDRTMNELVAAQFSTDGTQLVLAYGRDRSEPLVADEDSPRAIVVVTADTSRRVSAIRRQLAQADSPPQVAPSPDNRRLLLMQRANPSDRQAGDVLVARDASSGDVLGRVALPEGSRPLAWAWGRGEQEVVTVVRTATGTLLRSTTVLGSSSQVASPLAVAPGDFMALSPDGQRWLAKVGQAVHLFSVDDGQGTAGVPVLEQPVREVVFSGDGRHLGLVMAAPGPPEAVVLRGTEQPARVSDTPADLPAGLAFSPAPPVPTGNNAGRLPSLAFAGLVAAVALLAALAGTAWGRRHPPVTRQAAA